jgi:hypothetical protein
MNTPSACRSLAAQCELRFQSLFDAGRCYVFPCDAEGRVDMDALSDHSRQNYPFAHAGIGRELSYPAVIACDHH